MLEKLIRKGNSKGVDLVIQAGADVHAKDEFGGTLLHHAAYYDRDGEILDILTSKDIDLDVRDEDGKTALHWAAFANNTNAVVRFMLENADSNIKNNNGNTALHYLAEKGSAYSIERLIEFDAKPNIQNNNGMTPLCMAILNYERKGDPSNMLKLMEKDQDLDLTAYYYAQRIGFLPAIELLDKRFK